MAAERHSPDAILSQVGNTGSIGDIQDDPDSPDSNWLVADSNNVNTDVLTSFPTPSGNPNIGVDLQEFKALVRPLSSSQTGDPEARIELWESGSLVRAGSNTTLQNGGGDIIINFTWNANELSITDGGSVEAKVVGTKSGGSPTKRNTVDIGAIEWNADVESSVTNFQTIATTEISVLTFGRISTFARTLAIAESSLLTLSTLVTRYITLAVTEISSLVLSKLTTIFKTFSVIQTSAITLNKKINKTLSIVSTGIVSLATLLIEGGTTFFKTLTVTEISILSLTRIKTLIKTLTVTQVSNISLAAAQLILRSLSVVSTTSVSLTRKIGQLIIGAKTILNLSSGKIVGKIKEKIYIDL